MKLVLFLLKASWRTMLSASVIGGISGAASVAMFIFCVLRGLREAGTSPASVVGLFVALCLTIFLTRIVSQVLLSRLTQGAAVRLRLGLCEKILASPLARLEEIGLPGMFVALNGNVNMITRALNGVPMLVVNAVTLAGGFIYLGVLSLPLLGAVVLFWLIGVASYCYVWAIARPHLRRTREAEGVLAQHFRELINGVKEMKMHQSRRTEFVERALRPALDSVSHAKVVCDCLFDATLTWGRLWFFIAIGLLMFGWAKWFTLDGPTLTRYVFTIFYILSPVEQIMAWLPLLGWAENSVRKIEAAGADAGARGTGRRGGPADPAMGTNRIKGGNPRLPPRRADARVRARSRRTCDPPRRDPFRRRRKRQRQDHVGQADHGPVCAPSPARSTSTERRSRPRTARATGNSSPRCSTTPRSSTTSGVFRPPAWTSEPETTCGNWS